MVSPIAAPRAGLTAAWVSSGLVCGRGRHGAVGARRKARRESCVPGQVLPAPCVFAPRFRLEPCGRHTAGLSQTPRAPTASRDPLWSKGPRYWGYPGTMPARQIPQTQPCPRLGMLLGLTPNPRGAPAPHTPEAGPQQEGAAPGAPCTLQRCSPCQGCSPSHAASHVLLAPEGSTREPRAEQQLGPGARTACRGWGGHQRLSQELKNMEGKEERPRCPPVPSSWPWTQLRRGTPPLSPSGTGTRQGPGSHPRPGAGSRPHTSGGCERRCGRPVRGWEDI